MFDGTLFFENTTKFLPMVCIPCLCLDELDNQGGSKFCSGAGTTRSEENAARREAAVPRLVELYCGRAGLEAPLATCSGIALVSGQINVCNGGRGCEVLDEKGIAMHQESKRAKSDCGLVRNCCEIAPGAPGAIWFDLLARLWRGSSARKRPPPQQALPFFDHCPGWPQVDVVIVRWSVCAGR